VSELDREIETLMALREEIRRAHEVLKDLRAEIRAAREARKEFFAAPELEERLGKLTEEAMAAYADNVKQQIDRATEAVWNRFDTITMIALGEDPQSVREGKKTIPDLIREFIAAKGLPYRLTRISGQDGG
jgi:cobalamin biosynthesis protein CbiD